MIPSKSFPPVEQEKQLIFILAVYLLDLLGDKKPSKTQVLDFIKERGLITSFEGDSAPRSTEREKRMNDFDWATGDAKDRGLLTMPEIEIWQLTDNGKTWLLERASGWAESYENNPENIKELLHYCCRMNATGFTHMILIGQGKDVKEVPTALF